MTVTTLNFVEGDGISVQTGPNPGDPLTLDIEIASTVTATAGGADVSTATRWWMPLVDSDGTCVLDSTGNLIPTLITL